MAVLRIYESFRNQSTRTAAWPCENKENKLEKSQ